MGANRPRVRKEGSGGALVWMWIALMYFFTSDTVEPLGKFEFFWRTVAGPFNFLPGV